MSRIELGSVHGLNYLLLPRLWLQLVKGFGSGSCSDHFPILYFIKNLKIFKVFKNFHAFKKPMIIQRFLKGKNYEKIIFKLDFMF
jgi:hypothetical protein